MKPVFFLFFAISTALSAQWTETWNHQDFTTAPLWQGDLDKFTILSTEQKLQLDAEALASQAYISTISTAIENATWEFSVHMDFNPSSANYAIIYLAASQAEYNESMEGYYVMIGNTQDEVSLYKRTSGNNLKIIDGSDQKLNSSPASVYVRVVRDNVGNWQLYTKQDSNDYTLEGSVFDNEWVRSYYFGIYCQYSATRSNKFSFGPISVSGASYVDTQKPYITTHQLFAGLQFDIEFNEKIDPSSVSENDFEISPGKLHPDEVLVDQRQIQIHFNNYLQDSNSGLLKIKNIDDESGNTIKDTTLNYSFERIKALNKLAINEFLLQITFNKALDPSNMEKSLISSEISFETPTLKNDSTLLLVSTQPMLSDQTFALSLSGISATSGDVIKDTTLLVTYRKADRYDIVFSELMPDPSPNVGLYDSEYIEIYNRREYSINLEDMQLIINEDTTTLPNYELGANSYALIIHQNLCNSWPSDLPIIGIKGLPSLNNSSATLILSYPNNTVSDVIQYPIQTEDGGFKSDGGWSLERIDTNNAQSEFNWAFSDDLDGGTPGLENSVINYNPDVAPPYLQYITYTNPYTFEFVFNEALYGLHHLDTSSVQVEGVTISKLSYDAVFCNRIELTFTDSLPRGTIFTAYLLPSIYDYAHNELTLSSPLKLGVPEEPDSFDVVINEILFNPIPDGVDFVELFNRSDKILKRSDLYLSTLSNMTADKLEPIDDKDCLLFPKDYLVISEDTLVLKQTHPRIISAFMQQSGLPSLNDDQGNIAICKNTGELIDYFAYTSQMHFELLTEEEGVSLERINPHATTNNSHNWHSASKASNYATPTRQNSQYIDNTMQSTHSWLNITKKEFSPNADGIDDNLQINYTLDEVGWSGSLSIYNRYGSVVKTIANNELLGSNGFFIWDGTTDKGEKAPLGIYIIYADFFSTAGKTKQEKLTVVLTAGNKHSYPF